MSACIHGDVCREYLRQRRGIICQTCPTGCRFYEPKERTCHIIEQVETGPTSSSKVHRCSACGKPLPGWLFKGRRIISYCFKCGARVVAD